MPRPGLKRRPLARRPFWLPHSLRFLSERFINLWKFVFYICRLNNISAGVFPVDACGVVDVVEYILIYSRQVSGQFSETALKHFRSTCDSDIHTDQTFAPEAFSIIPPANWSPCWRSRKTCRSNVKLRLFFLYLKYFVRFHVVQSKSFSSSQAIS